MLISELIFGLFISNLLVLLHNPGYSLEIPSHYVAIKPVFLQTSTGTKGHVLQGNNKGNDAHPNLVKRENESNHNEKDNENNGLKDGKKAEVHESNVHDSPTHIEPINEHGHKDVHDHHEEFPHDDHEHEEYVDEHAHPDHTSKDYIEEDHNVDHQSTDKTHDEGNNVEDILNNKHNDVDHGEINAKHKRSKAEDKHEYQPDNTHKDTTTKPKDKHLGDETKNVEETKGAEPSALTPVNEHKRDVHEVISPHKEEAKPDVSGVDNHHPEHESYSNEKTPDVQVNAHEEQAKEGAPEVVRTPNVDTSHEHHGNFSVRKLDATCSIDCNPACQNMLGGKTQCVKDGGNDRLCTPLNKVETFDCDDGYVPCSIPAISTVETYTLHKSNNEETGELDIEGNSLNRCVGLIIADKNSVCSKASLDADLDHTSKVLNPNYDVTVSENKLSFTNLHILPGDYKICIYQQYDTSLSKLRIYRFITIFLEFLGLYHPDDRIKTLYSLQVGTLVVSN